MVIRATPQTDVPVARDKLIERTDKEFTDGVCGGYLTYCDQYHGKPLTDMVVYHLLAQNIMEVRSTDLSNAGYCTGLIEPLIEDRDVFAQ
jgi:hypothetical protein